MAWKTDFDGALRLEAGGLTLRVKRLNKGYDGYEWIVWQEGCPRVTGVHEGPNACEKGKDSARVHALNVLLEDLNTPKEVIQEILVIAGF